MTQRQKLLQIYRALLAEEARLGRYMTAAEQRVIVEKYYEYDRDAAIEDFRYRVIAAGRKKCEECGEFNDYLLNFEENVIRPDGTIQKDRVYLSEMNVSARQFARVLDDYQDLIEANKTAANNAIKRAVARGIKVEDIQRYTQKWLW